MSQDSNESKNKDKIIAQLTSLLEKKISENDIANSQLQRFSEQLDILLSQSHQEQQSLRDLFKSLVPTQLPKIDGFSFSRKFNYGTEKGSDYFDLFPHVKDPSWSLILSSCERYATSANIMGQIFEFESVFSQGSRSAAEDMSSFLASLTELSPDDRFHLLYAKMNRASLSLDFYCQGSIIGFVTSPSAPLIRISSDAPAMATLKDLGWSSSPIEMATRIKTAQVKLAPGNRVSIFSPGVLNVLSEADLAKHCRDFAGKPIHDLRNEIGFQLERVSGRPQPKQDQVVFMFEVNKNTLALA